MRNYVFLTFAVLIFAAANANAVLVTCIGKACGCQNGPRDYEYQIDPGPGEDVTTFYVGSDTQNVTNIGSTAAG